jgi:charged multivesicular body protein 6
MGVFKSKTMVTSQDRAILELKVQRDKLQIYTKKINLVIEKELQIAKEQLLVKNHHLARLALSRKKYQEKLLENTENQIMNIEKLVNSIEYKLVEQQVVKGLQQGNAVLDKLNKEMDINQLEQILNDTAEAIEYQNELQTLLSANLSSADESDVMKELDQLIQQEADEKLAELPSLENMPQVPEGKEKKTKDAQAAMIAT